MVFNSLEFLLFFPIVLFVYFVLPPRFRWVWLLTASCVFYAAYIPKYIFIMFFIVLWDFYTGLAIERAQDSKKKKLFLAASILGNLGILVVFKYFNFINFNLTEILAFFDLKNPVSDLHVLLPLGLSFHTFQAMAYTIEVYRGNYRAETHLGYYALYIFFFPQMVAGPIERPANLLPQLKQSYSFDLSRLRVGLSLMAMGFFKKCIIADTAGIFVNTVYGNPTHFSGAPLILATYFFAIQVYFDFSGYTDIARGVARTMGYDLSINFNNPYSARTLAEFWQRWHISLTSWLRDYVYTPLLNLSERVSVWKMYFAITAVFLLCGLWHGANWTFIVFGAIHAFSVIFSQVTKNIRKSTLHFFGITPNSTFHKTFQVITTFHIVAFSFIFFRATTVADAWYIVTHLFVSNYSFAESLSLADYFQVDRFLFFMVILSLSLLNVVQRIQDWTEFQAGPRWIRWSFYYVVGVMLLGLSFIAVSNQASGPQQFIYFQF